MEIIALAILGLVQGLSEFLPISSSGHLLLIGKLFGITDSIFVSILLHVATLLSILVVYRKDVVDMIKHPFSKQTTSICIATIPTCLIVLVLMPIVKKSFGGNFLYISFLISAIILLFVQIYSKKHVGKEFSLKNALIMGIAQGFAVFPGVSRSGTTISAGLLSGGEKGECAKFSFLMSIPIILVSMAGEIFEICQGGQVLSINIFGAVIAFVIAFLSGLFSIKFMISLTKKANFMWISGYLVVIAVIAKIVM